MITALVLLGLALFILRSQLLRVAMEQSGAKDTAALHASPALGAASGWASLAGAACLMLLALVLHGYMWGAIIVLCGIGAGVILSSLALPLIAQTVWLGHVGGEGTPSVVAFNRLYGAWVAFAVPAAALAGWAMLWRWL